MNQQRATILNCILNQGMLPLFFYEDAEISLQATRTLYRAGVRALEYTNRGHAALENFKLIKKACIAEMPEMRLGVGTIKTTGEADDFIKAGAEFIVAPVVKPAVAEIAAKNDILWCPGCMTPTEISLAQENGAALIKLFPANILGPQFLISIKELFPGQLFMPTGGVELNAENIGGWFRAGVCAIGVGSKLITMEVLTKGLYDKLYTETQKVLKLVQAAKQNQ
jgi:2-dehydro-3-deoxyphosphogluconate aldolase/(4S)-4-hydroxy-2-oxoglutarate aldolase